MTNKALVDAAKEAQALNEPIAVTYTGLDPYAVDDFTRAYMECALWTSTDGDVNLDDNHDITDIAPETLGKMIADCQRFQTEYSAALKMAYHLYKLPADGETTPQDMAGHDFWLTRNGHGAGFWDRGLGEHGEVLSKACGWRSSYPEIDLYIGDDGKIYQS